jgi:Mg/Co/Ni transporter MgtE
LGALLGRDTANRAPLIDWADVVPLADGGPTEGGAVQLRVPRDKLATLHPADLARVVEQLSPRQGADLLSGFDDARAADTLEELEDEQQAHVLRAMDPERAADLLEEMEPDEAADALQSFTPDEAEDLLGRMDPDEAEDVQELYEYPDDSAGGLMTTEYVSVPAWATAGGVIAALRARARESQRDEADPLPDALPELYIVAEDPPEGAHPADAADAARESGADGTAPAAATWDPFEPRAATVPVPLNAEGRLVGVLALRELLLAYPEARLIEIMLGEPHVASPRDSARDAARVIAEDDLVALPVVDEAGRMLGIVTVDDAIDVIVPAAWKKRLPRTFR